MNQPRATLAAGMQVTPSVRLVSPLGAGGMGAVWLADHTALNTRVVVKFMLDALDSSASARARFKREAEAASQVKSPHVVQTFDYGVTSEGVAFIVMEHLEGRDLGAEIAARGALEPKAVVAIITQVSKALTKAHAAGLLHRDIKPDNIFLCDGESEDDLFVKLLDFGIVKASAAEGESTLDGQTKTGQVVGTPFYMSPEQVTAQKDIDFRSDLWSLGIVTFEALTGKRPYDGPSFGALAVKIATGETPRPSSANEALPSSVDAWFAQACARDPAKRFGSARELADRLRASFDGVVSLPPIVSGISDSGPREATSARGKVAAAGTTPSPMTPAARTPSTPQSLGSVPPGPISVDDDAHSRPSFVLASTVGPEGAPVRADGERSALARSEGGAAVAIPPADAETSPGRSRPRRPGIRGVAAVIVVAGATLGLAFGLSDKEPARPSAKSAAGGGKSAATIPSELATAAPRASVAEPPASPSAAASGSSSTPAVAASASGGVLASAASLTDAGTHVLPASSAHVAVPVRPPSASATPVTSVPPVAPHPTTTSQGDPLY